jgi:hypothetical protein
MIMCVSPLPPFPSFTTATAMNSWTLVLSAKEKRDMKNYQKILRTFTSLATKYRYNHIPSVDAEGIPVDHPSIPRPFTRSPHNSPLLSEQIGSTDPRVIAKKMYYSFLYNRHESVHDLFAKYTVPIYHWVIDCDEDWCDGPCIEYIRVYVWTFGADNVPLVHMYGAPPGLSLKHTRTISAFEQDDDKYDNYYTRPDVVVRMMELLDI